MPAGLHDPALPLHGLRGRPDAATGYGRVVGLGFVFVWFAVGGAGHFLATQAEMQVVPPWVTWPHEAVLLSGALEWLGAAGLLWQPSRRVAGLGLFLLALAVSPVHVYMLQHASLFNVPGWALWVRLPLQAALMGLIWWSTQTPRRPTADAVGAAT